MTARGAAHHQSRYIRSLYGKYDLGEHFFVKGSASYSYNNIEAVRHDVGGIGLDATGKFDADLLGLTSELGKNFLFDKTLVTPSLLVRGSHYVAS